MSALKIGKGVELPLSIVTSKIAILAMTGAGKTYLAKVLAEEMLDQGVQIAVADYTGVWRGLASSADGKRPGYNVIVFGGDHGDMPLREDMGTLIADAVVKEKISPIIDLSGFEHDAPKIRLMTAFAQRLYHANRRPMHLFIDEADEFIPQVPQREQIGMFSAVKRIWQRGRVRGIGGTLISQRSALVNKSLLSQSETLIALRTVGPQDRKALESWFNAYGTDEQIEQFKSTIASLKKHHAWFWSPAHDLFTIATARPLKTFDSGKTPDAAIEISEPKARTEHDIERLTKMFGKLAEEAKSNDPDVLKKQAAHFREQFEIAKKRIGILEERERKRDKPAPTGKPVRVPVLTKPQIKAVQRAVLSLTRVRADISDALKAAASAVAEDVEPATRGLIAALGKVDAIGKVDITAAVRQRAVPPAVPFVDKSPELSANRGFSSGNGDGGPVSGQIRLLRVLAQYGPMPQSRARILAAVASPNTMRVYVGAAKGKGYITGNGDRLELTEAGQIAAGSFEALPTGPALIEHWRRELGDSGHRRIFDVLIKSGGTASQEHLQRAAGVNSANTMRVYVGRLRTLGILKRSTSGGWIALDDAFHEMVQ